MAHTNFVSSIRLSAYQPLFWIQMFKNMFWGIWTFSNTIEQPCCFLIYIYIFYNFRIVIYFVYFVYFQCFGHVANLVNRCDRVALREETRTTKSETSEGSISKESPEPDRADTYRAATLVERDPTDLPIPTAPSRIELIGRLN